MKKRVASLLLAFVMLFAMTPTVLAATVGMANFKKTNTYAPGQFTDVKASDWYAASVQSAYEMGLVKGSSATTYNPTGNITIAETVALASRIHNIYQGGSGLFVQGTPWYQVYVDYAISVGIIKYSYDYNAAATRSQFAEIIAASMPSDALPAINNIADNALPDMKITDPYGAAVYRLYRAGILTGSDEYGTFNPNSNIQRSEVAAILARMTSANQRKIFTLKARPRAELSAEDIYAQCSPAVFFIEVYNSSGQAFATGSGFFIDESGIAVTNYHVIDGAYSAKIFTSDTELAYEVAGVLDYDEKEDWAVIQISGSGFPVLKIGDTSTVVGGGTVYAIGSPLGLQNSISQGIIANTNRIESGVRYLQTTAAISSGSSGGALINKYGDVIGITSATYVDGQNLNLALPISVVDGYKTGTIQPLAELFGYSNPSARHTAFDLLVDYILTYGNVTIGSEQLPAYEKSYSDKYGMHIQQLIYDQSDHSITVRYSRNSTFVSYLVLTQDDDIFGAGLFAYESIYSEDWYFYGFSAIQASSFDADTVRFSEYEGYYGLVESGEKILGYMIALSLIFTDDILEDYSGYYGLDYGVQDLGFTSFFY